MQIRVHSTKPPSARRRACRRRAAILVGVAAAQSSQGYDLACRGTVSVAGSVQTLPNSSIGLVSAVGQPGAGLVRSSN
jgi:hypothetical protein